MNSKVAIFSASCDPITYGHIDIINRACDVFDKVIVAVGSNPNKKYTFSIDQRIKMIEKAIDQNKVIVKGFTGLLADFAFQEGVKTIIKGVRNNQDFDYERLLHEVTITQQIGIDTHILISNQTLSHVSSSAVKELCRHQGLIHEYVPLSVKAALEYEINQQTIIGITGSIGTGKSYTTEKLIQYYSKQVNVLHIDMDIIAHELYTRTENGYIEFQDKVKKTFNLNVNNLTELRKKLGNIVFNDNDALKELNKLTRQPLLTLMRQKMYGFKGVIFLNGALLVEANFLPLCNNNIVIVDAPTEQQITNLKNRGLDTSQIQRRINSQLTNAQKIQMINDSIVKHKYGMCFVHENNRNKDEIESMKILTNSVSRMIYTR